MEKNTQPALPFFFFSCELTRVDMWCYPFQLLTVLFTVSHFIVLVQGNVCYFLFNALYSKLLVLLRAHFSLDFLSSEHSHFYLYFLSRVIGSTLMHRLHRCVTVQAGSWFRTLYRLYLVTFTAQLVSTCSPFCQQSHRNLHNMKMLNRNWMFIFQVNCVLLLLLLFEIDPTRVSLGNWKHKYLFSFLHKGLKAQLLLLRVRSHL